VEGLLFVGFGVLVVGAIVLSLYLKARRRKEFLAFARRHDLRFSAADPFGLLGWPYPLFSRGHGRGVENVLWGDWEGRPIVAFDYWYYTESTDSEGRRTRNYRRFNCAQIEIPGAFPVLEIAPEGFFTRLADAVGLDDIQFESEEFNRRFNVKSGDRKFASDMIDPRMMRWLLALPVKVSFEVVGSRVLVYGRRVKAARLIPIIGTATAFPERIPRVVWSLYPAG
jgi:hypothetical protein